ncbi:hypothetical protein [Cryobacterium adonitolivorans]|uniref:hypothetical protein n=1 Tax=Cryobacterium adonitolivorans TaxID=1259189 RepID=UPI001F546ECA|nr:hypothetical protein [Cryobacterium adonitolivorans]
MIPTLTSGEHAQIGSEQRLTGIWSARHFHDKIDIGATHDGYAIHENCSLSELVDGSVGGLTLVLA